MSSAPYAMCKSLGTAGRLGNQMFQFAVLVGVASKTSHRIAIPKSNRSTNPFQDLQLDKVFNINAFDCASVASDTVVCEPSHDMRYLPSVQTLSLQDGNVDFRGYFQSEKYFKHAEAKVKQHFTFSNPKQKQHTLAALQQCRSVFSPKTGQVVALHVRRGDYLKLPMYHPFSTQYYDFAMRLVCARTGGKCHFVVISDDVAWCKQHFATKTEYGTFSYTDGNMTGDLAVMRYADHCIITNSSFSWWGAWLNESPNKIVVCPERWFGPKGPKTHDLFVPGWDLVAAEPAPV